MGKQRPWKTAKPTTAGAEKVMANRATWEQRMQQRAATKAVQEAQHAIDEEIRAEKREERARREEKEKKKKENRIKGSSYQVITNTSKIKKMSKKQLKSIRKADTS